ncbi:hypothetical protein EUX98_g9796 [Antrodiella citrinella]|uniref:Uncharacterized protein n=1 Tax=Antrodiella citrinella TaxID=2447956 RepID=A0A4S4LL21_9APHY|nr:hypothetical protein EUX98_g9796 [Antrodiella citrinella]
MVSYGRIRYQRAVGLISVSKLGKESNSTRLELLLVFREVVRVVLTDVKTKTRDELLRIIDVAGI